MITLQNFFNCVYIEVKEEKERKVFNVCCWRRKRQEKHSLNLQFHENSQTSLFPPWRMWSIYFISTFFFSSQVLTDFLARQLVWRKKMRASYLVKMCMLSAKIINSTLVFVINPEGKYFILKHQDLHELCARSSSAGRNFSDESIIWTLNLKLFMGRYPFSATERLKINEQLKKVWRLIKHSAIPLKSTRIFDNSFHLTCAKDK